MFNNQLDTAISGSLRQGDLLEAILSSKKDGFDSFIGYLGDLASSSKFTTPITPWFRCQKSMDHMIMFCYRVKQLIVDARTVIHSKILKSGAIGSQIEESLRPYVRTARQFLEKT